MQTLIDTTCWSVYLRRQRNAQRSDADVAVERLVGSLLAEGEALVIGAVRQEVLSGVRTPEQFTTLRDFLRGLEDQATTSQDYETAAQFHNVCRRAGVQGSTTDFLLCAVANRLDVPILSSDRDFLRFAEQLPIVLADV